MTIPTTTDGRCNRMQAQQMRHGFPGMPRTNKSPFPSCDAVVRDAVVSAAGSRPSASLDSILRYAEFRAETYFKGTCVKYFSAVVGMGETVAQIKGL